MKRLLLIGFSQDVRLMGDGPKNFLVFETEDGKEKRVPVGEDSIRAVMEIAYSDEKGASAPAPAAPKAEPEEEIPEFGGDETPGESQEDAPEVYQLSGDTSPSTLAKPQSEAEVPPL